MIRTSLAALAMVVVAAAGPWDRATGLADRALAGEPMVLSDAELDQVTAGQEQISLVFAKITPAVEGEIRWTFVNAFPKKLDGVHIVLTHPAGSVDRGTPDRQR